MQRLRQGEVWKRFLDLVFHPLLWCLPFMGLTIVSLYQVWLYGVFEARFGFETQGKSYGSLNVLFFSLLWLWSMLALSKMRFERMSRVYLCFCVIFSAYGIGEIISKLFVFESFVQQYGLFASAKGVMYDLFFLFNHVPLYVFLKDRKNQFFGLFLLLQGVHAVLYMIFSYAEVNSLWELVALRSLYYPTRGLAVLMYAILLLGFLDLASLKGWRQWILHF